MSTPRESNIEKDLREAEGLCKKFKTTLSRPDVKVHFVGAWYIYYYIFLDSVAKRTMARDTVSSIGIARDISLPETTTGMRHVCVFRHALALDERRVKFLPEYVNGGRGPTKEGDSESKGDVKEVWFSGTHSDM
jgi:uncharacterized protein (DUF2235 family)